MNQPTIRLDVREDIRLGREPFPRIMSAVSRLSCGQDLLLIAPFEPVPLYHVLGGRGFTHRAQRAEDGDWEILFRREHADSSRSEAEGPVSARTVGGSPNAARETVEIDARRLEPPQPLVAILEALSVLPDGAELRARTDRRPLHLYARLEERGFVGQTHEENGSFITCIRRR